MRYSIRALFGWVLIFLGSGSWAGPLQLLQRNRYLEAIRAWEADASAIKATETSVRAIKGQALAYSELGNLYAELHRFAFELQDQYYESMAKHYASPILSVYRSQVDFYAGRYAKAIKGFEKAIVNKESSSLLRDMAKVYRHFSMNALKHASSGLILKTQHPSVEWQLLQLSGKKGPPDGLEAEDARSLRNKLQILVRDDAVGEEEFEQVLFKFFKLAEEPEMYLDQGKLTQVNFYDPQVFHALSVCFYYMSRFKHQALEAHARQFSRLAKKFEIDFNLAENNYALGRYEQAEKYLGNSDDFESRLLRARIHAARGDAKEAEKVLSGMERMAKEPAQLRELGFAYFQLDVDPKKALAFTRKAVNENKSSKYQRRFAAVLLGSGFVQEALEAYARGYKIQYRNSVDHIEPHYMTEYAYAIFKSGKMRYDEVVETLYHLQKAYPAVRQMHYCMQGIAAAETRAFGNEKIFRKGG